MNNNPFSQFLMDTPDQVRSNGDFRNFADLNPDQRREAERMIGGAQTRDIYDALVQQSRAIAQTNKVLRGIESEDIDINVDPQTGASKWSIRQQESNGEGGDSLPAITWADRFKVLAVTVVDEVEQTVAWDKDYVRSVAATTP